MKIQLPLKCFYLMALTGGLLPATVVANNITLQCDVRYTKQTMNLALTYAYPEEQSKERITVTIQDIGPYRFIESHGQNATFAFKYRPGNFNIPPEPVELGGEAVDAATSGSGNEWALVRDSKGVGDISRKAQLRIDRNTGDLDYFVLSKSSSQGLQSLETIKGTCEKLDTGHRRF